MLFPTKKIRLSKTFHLGWWIHCKQPRLLLKAQLGVNGTQRNYRIRCSWAWQLFGSLAVSSCSCPSSLGISFVQTKLTEEVLALITLPRWSHNSPGKWNRALQTLSPTAEMKMTTCNCSKRLKSASPYMVLVEEMYWQELIKLWPFWAWETSQSADCLPYKHGESASSLNPVRKPGAAVHASHLGDGEVETEGSLGLIG